MARTKVETAARKVELAARSAANKRVLGAAASLGWTEAKAEAPWDESLPAAQERFFRIAYAIRLVERGMAIPAGIHRTPRPSGSHAAPRRKLSAPAEQLEAWDAKAKRAGLPWAEWARRALDAAP